MPNYCCVAGCKQHSAKSADESFHFIPKDNVLRKKWIKAIRRKNWVPSNQSRVCSRHFEKCDFTETNSASPVCFQKRHLKREAIPSLNLRCQAIDERVPKRRTKTSLAAGRVENRWSTDKSAEILLPDANIIEADHEQASSSTGAFHGEMSVQCNLEDSENFQLVSQLRSRIECHEKELEKLRRNISSNFRYANLSDEDISSCCKIPRNSFEIISCHLKRFQPFNYYGGRRVVSIEFDDQLLIFLSKLGLGLSDSFIALLFGVSRTTIRNVFFTFLNLFYETVYVPVMDGNIPSMVKNQLCMPNSFSDFSNCRIIIDCTEFRIDLPKDLNKRSVTYSNYKSTYTAKILIGCAPNGTITFVSEAFGGNASDKQITNDSGVVSHFVAGDLILADKGFTIHDLFPQAVYLNIPPFLSGKQQFTKAEAILTRNIARNRIIVERAIQRLKMFEILEKIPHNLRPFLTKIIRACASLVNFQKPLFNKIFEKD